jgi:uncharacterized membrane protein
MLFESHMEAIVFFCGMFVYIALLSFFGYREAKTKDEKKDFIAFIAVLGPLFVVSLAIVVYFGYSADALPCS